MWTSTIDLDPGRVFLTKLLSYVWRKAHFASFAPLQVQNVPRQALLTTNWVRVRNRLAGIGGNDLHLVFDGGDFRVAPAALPDSRRIFPGNELVGEVIEIGEDVRHLQVGDRVVLQWGPNCLSDGAQSLCSSCSTGHYNLCERGVFATPQQLGGGWSEELLLHECRLYRVMPDLSDEQAVLLEPSATALHAVLRHLPLPGDRVLIVGAGTIGLLTLQIVRALVPQVEVSVLARHPFQVEQATRMGAAHIIYPQDSYGGVQRATQAHLYRGPLGNKLLLGGYDIIYDTIGKQQTLHHTLRWARAGATIVLVGLNLHYIHIDLTPLWYREINLIGSCSHGLETGTTTGTNRPRSTFSMVEEMIVKGLIHPEQLITHRFALNHYREALYAAARKMESRAIKVLFDYSLLPASVVPNVRASARRPRSTAMMQPAALSRRYAQLEEDEGDADMFEPAPRSIPAAAAPTAETPESRHAATGDAGNEAAEAVTTGPVEQAPQPSLSEASNERHEQHEEREEHKNQTEQYEEQEQREKYEEQTAGKRDTVTEAPAQALLQEETPYTVKVSSRPPRTKRRK